MIEVTRERRKVLWAVLASVLVHLVVAYSLAAFSGPPKVLPAADDAPAELTLVDMATPPPVPKNPGYVETDPARASAEKPKEQTFESNANSIGASNAAATGDAPLPSQDGKDRPFMSLNTQQLSLPSEGSTAPRPTPQNKAEQSATPAVSPSVTPEPSPTEPEQLAMLRPTPSPAFTPEQKSASPAEIASPVPTPPEAQPRANFQAQKEQTRISGRLTNRGASSVNAVGTPLGRYQKQVSDAIGSRWYYYMKNKIDLVNVGTAHVEAEVDPQGRVQNLRVLSNNANEAFANICLQSFQEAKLPPIPPDLVPALPGGKMPIDFYFTTYNN